MRVASHRSRLQVSYKTCFCVGPVVLVSRGVSLLVVRAEAEERYPLAHVLEGVQHSHSRGGLAKQAVPMLPKVVGWLLLMRILERSDPIPQSLVLRVHGHDGVQVALVELPEEGDGGVGELMVQEHYDARIVHLLQRRRQIHVGLLRGPQPQLHILAQHLVALLLAPGVGYFVGEHPGEGVVEGARGGLGAHVLLIPVRGRSVQAHHDVVRVNLRAELRLAQQAAVAHDGARALTHGVQRRGGAVTAQALLPHAQRLGVHP
mmetsp:Transcript_12654/g.24004  ORF Transcript_12654/g.24004 Transcript_12654/m.24004 type:complete len:261 (+) Transcript_12654:622-1404(+)